MLLTALLTKDKKFTRDVPTEMQAESEKVNASGVSATMPATAKRVLRSRTPRTSAIDANTKKREVKKPAKPSVDQKLLAAKQRREQQQKEKKEKHKDKENEEKKEKQEQSHESSKDPFNLREKKLLASFGEHAFAGQEVQRLTAAECEEPVSAHAVLDTRTPAEKDNDPTEDGRCQRIMHRLFLGDVCSSAAPERLERLGIGAVLNMASELPNRYPERFVYKKIALADLPSTAVDKHFEAAFAFIDEHRRRHGVLVHCMAGASRSASIVIAYIMRTHRLPLHDAFWWTKHRRLCVWPNFGFVRQLAALERSLGVQAVRLTGKDGKEAALAYDADEWMWKPVRAIPENFPPESGATALAAVVSEREEKQAKKE